MLLFEINLNYFNSSLLKSYLSHNYFVLDQLIKWLTSQIEGFIAKLLNMENMLCNANRLQRAEMEKIVFEGFKKDEQMIMKSLSYRKYCKIKDLTSMFDKTQPIVVYNKVRAWVAWKYFQILSFMML